MIEREVAALVALVQSIGRYRFLLESSGRHLDDERNDAAKEQTAARMALDRAYSRWSEEYNEL